MAPRPSTAESLPVVLRFLQQFGTLDQLTAFLKERGVSPYYCSSWEIARESRVPQALDDGAITFDDLAGFMGELEEHGQQHVFLFEPLPDARSPKSLISKSRVQGILKRLGAEDTWDRTKLVQEPLAPTISSTRIEDGPFGRRLVVKVVEVREYREPAGDEVVEGDFVIVRYRIVRIRRVNVFVLHETGLLEARMQSHRRGTRYRDDIDRTWDLVEALIPRQFAPVAVTQAKSQLWKRRDELTGLVRHSKNTARNDHGSEIQVTGSSLAADEHAAGAMDEFLRSDSYMEYGNHYWLPQDDGIPSQEVHVIMKGEVNEFVVTQNCSPEDFNYALGKLLDFNS